MCKMQMMFSVSSRCEWIPGLPAGPSCHGDGGTFRQGRAEHLGISPHHPTTHRPNLSLSSFPDLSAGHLPPNSHAVCLLTATSSSLCLPTTSNHTEEPSAEALSRSFISVITSQRACGSLSQHPLALFVAGERMATPEVLMRTNGSHAGRAGLVSTGLKPSKT